MLVTNRETGTNICEVADGIYRINTPVPIPGQQFSFNQYLMLADEPLLFHTGLRGLFSHVRDAVASVMPVERLRHISFSHVEADECGSLNLWLEAAPRAAPLCGAIAAMVSVGVMGLLYVNARGRRNDKPAERRACVVCIVDLISRSDQSASFSGCSA